MGMWTVLEVVVAGACLMYASVSRSISVARLKQKQLILNVECYVVSLPLTHGSKNCQEARFVLLCS